MDNESNFAFRRVFVSIKRKYVSILFFLLYFLIVGAVYSYGVAKTNYISTGSVKSKWIVSSGGLQKIIDASKNELADEVFKDLSDKNITHKNGVQITKGDIVNGLILPNKTTQILSFSFQSSDSIIPTKVLDVYMEKLVDYCNVELATNVFEIETRASETVATTNPLVTTILFAGIGLVIGVAIVVINGCANYAIDSSKDLSNTHVFEIEYRGGKKHE